MTAATGVCHELGWNKSCIDVKVGEHCTIPWSQSHLVGLLYRVSQKEWTKLRESVPYVKIYRYNPKHLYPKFNGYGDNSKRSLTVYRVSQEECEILRESIP